MKGKKGDGNRIEVVNNWSGDKLKVSCRGP